MRARIPKLFVRYSIPTRLSVRAMAESVSSILVTGASGYIATHLIQQLQQEGYRVRGTVRSTKDENKVKAIRELCPGAKYDVELVEADLNKPEGWVDAVRGCEYVMHVASPFPAAQPKNEDEVIRPAVDGTLHVLKACKDVGGVRRVVLTSSVVAVTTMTGGSRGKVHTEKDWTDIQQPGVSPYYKSKTLAEKAAWDFMGQLPEGEKFELAVINPGFVMGPVLCGSFTTSMELPKQILERQMPLLPNFCVNVVDVRDVAKAHVVAMKHPEAAGNRHILVAGNLWMKEMAQIWDKEFKPQGYKVPTSTAPNFAVKFIGLFDPTIKFITPGLGKEIVLDNSRMKNVLGINPYPLEDTLNDMAHSMIQAGKLKKSAKYKGQQLKTMQN